MVKSGYLWIGCPDYKQKFTWFKADTNRSMECLVSKQYIMGLKGDSYGWDVLYKQKITWLKSGTYRLDILFTIINHVVNRRYVRMGCLDILCHHNSL